MSSKVLFLALGVAALGVARDASAGCSWQWQGISSHFVCTPDEASCVDVINTSNATVVNDTAGTVYYDAQCGEGPASAEQLAPGASRVLSCDSSPCSGGSTLIVVSYGTGPGGQTPEKYEGLTGTQHFRWAGPDLILTE